MCGFILTNSSEPIWEEGSLSHRGPDQAVLERTNGITIEFFRLAIVGGPAGNAPVKSADGIWKVFFNGEIYNYKRLQTTFQLAQTSSDTQTLANGLSKRGVKFLNYLRGMFAGVAIDTKNGFVYIFRDALGEKPLFYSQNGNRTIISSEVRPIIKSLGGLSVSNEGLADFAHLGYIEEPKTIDSRVWAFPRGTVHSLDTCTGVLKRISVLPGYDDSETSAELPDLIDEVFREIGYSEIPSSILLSGGFDSGSLLTVLSKMQAPGQLLPISIGFKPKFSEMKPRANLAIRRESQKARAVASRLGIDLATVRIDSRSTKYWLEELVKVSDQPLADPSGIGYLAGFRESGNRGRKVSYVGHGADEFFWGYPWLNEYLNSTRSEQHLNYHIECFWPEHSPLLHMPKMPHFAERDFGSFDPFLRSKDSWRRSRAFQAHSYLSHNGFAQVDRLAMSEGIEARSPWADSRLYGWSQTNPIANSVSALNKTLLKDSVDLGRNNKVKKFKKSGFLSPIDIWVRHSGAQPFARYFEIGLTLLQSTGWATITLEEMSSQAIFRTVVLGIWHEHLLTPN